jgi:hypothetical protein
MDKSQQHLRVTKSPRDNEEVVNDNGGGKKERPLSHQELMAQIATKGTVFEREMCVVENLRRMGLK